MAYSVPNFNLLGRVWRYAERPGDGFPHVYDNVPCQLYVPSRSSNVDLGLISIRTPKNLQRQLLDYDIWEVPIGTGRFFRTLKHVRVHEGFINEYFSMMALRVNSRGNQIEPGLP